MWDSKRLEHINLVKNIFMKKLLILVLFCVVFSGCWDSSDIEDRAIILGIYIDIKDSKYNVLFESAQVKDNSLEKTWTIGSGADFPAAIDDIKAALPNPVYYNSVCVIALGAGVNNDAAKEIFERLHTRRDFRSNIDAFFIEDDLETVRENKISSEDLSKSIKTLEKEGLAREVLVSEVLKIYASGQNSLTLPKISNGKITGEKSI
jgi:hypothetical protein